MDTAMKQVTVKLDAKQSKPTNTKKNNKTQPDVDLHKEFTRAKDEGIVRLNLSKNNITVIPSSIKECTHLVELYLYGNKIASLPPEIGYLTQLQTLALNENQVMISYIHVLIFLAHFLINSIIITFLHLFIAELITGYIAEFDKIKSFRSSS